MSRRGVLAGTLAAGYTAISGNARAEAPAAASGTRVLHVRPMGYDGGVPGPPLRIIRGEELRIRLVNELAEPTAIHWHGVRIVNAMDGAPPLTQAAVQPGESFDVRFAAPDAGTFWYRAPFPGRHGHYGVLVVTETEPVDIDRDVTLLFAHGAGPQDTQPFSVNGAPNLDIAAGINERLRLRLLNASASDMLSLRISGLRSFVMATDGQPAEPFAARDGRLSLGPGNRVDVFVDCTLAAGASAPIFVEGANSPIARIVCQAAAARRATPRPEPLPLPANPLPQPMDFAAALRSDQTVDQAADRGERPIFTVKKGRTVVMKLLNSTLENAYIHLHGHSFRLLDALDDGWKPFWLDTLPLGPQTEARLAFVADNPGRWLIEGLGAKNRSGAWFEVS